MDKKEPHWKKKPEDDDYVAAGKYLSLLYSKKQARRLIRDMRKCRTVEYAAKDLLRYDENAPIASRMARR